MSAGQENVAAHGRRPSDADRRRRGPRADLAIARINGNRPDLEGVEEALAPVLELPPVQRINGIVNSVNRVNDAVRRSAAAGTPKAEEIQEQIEMFTRVAAASITNR